jgi:hypothetical protein
MEASEECKDRGNKFYTQKLYKEAIEGNYNQLSLLLLQPTIT